MRARMRGAGFTLLEMLVVTVVLGLLMAVLSAGVGVGLRGWARQTMEIDRQADFQEVESALRRLLEAADGGEAGRPVFFTGANDRLSFTASVPLNDGVRHDVAIGLGVDSRHRLVVRWHMSRSPGCDSSEPIHEEILLDHVEAIHLRYWSMMGDGQWNAGWTRKALPGLIEMTIARMNDAHVRAIIVHPSLGEYVK